MLWCLLLALLAASSATVIDQGVIGDVNRAASCSDIRARLSGRTVVRSLPCMESRKRERREEERERANVFSKNSLLVANARNLLLLSWRLAQGCAVLSPAVTHGSLPRGVVFLFFLFSSFVLFFSCAHLMLIRRSVRIRGFPRICPPPAFWALIPT